MFSAPRSVAVHCAIRNSGKDGIALRTDLFDYETDPDETCNHAAAQPEVARELLARLDRVLEPRVSAEPTQSKVSEVLNRHQSLP